MTEPSSVVPPDAADVGLRAQRMGAADPEPSFLRFHPCYSESAHFRYGRIHLPVAPRCNIHCNYCDRKVGDCYHTYRPGVSSRVMVAEEAAAWVADALEGEPRLRVAGIAGPGEPLANADTFRTLELVRRRFPHLMLCLSTNGLLLPHYVAQLATLGVRTITVTVNALRPDIGARIVAWVSNGPAPEAGQAPEAHRGAMLLRGEEGASLLVRRQLEGIALASAAGMAVKVNTVLVPGLNEAEIGPIAAAAQERGAVIQNVMPLIPLGHFRQRRPPTCEELEAARAAGEAFLPQFRRCRQCRADAVGVPGEETGGVSQARTWSPESRAVQRQATGGPASMIQCERSEPC
jgi:nitrogen fixation protein NifB